MITQRPAEPGDLALLAPDPLPHRARFVTLVDGDEVIAVGGLIFRPDGTVWISACITDKARRAKVALHRAGLAVMGQARRSGIRRVFAAADPDVPRAEAWLERLGLKPTAFCEDGRRIWMWQA